MSVWVKNPLKVHVYLKPQTVTLFGNSVFVDIISQGEVNYTFIVN